MSTNDPAFAPEVATELARRISGTVHLAQAFSTVTISSRNVAEHLGRPRLYVLAAVGAAVEMASGAEREWTAGSVDNAMKLARHLLEVDIDTDYLVNHPTAATRQLEAREVEQRQGLQKAMRRAGVRPPPIDPVALQEFARRARDTKLRRRREKEAAESRVGPLPITEVALPSIRGKAVAMGRRDEYDVWFGASSWLAHAGVVTYERALSLSDDDRSARLGPAADDGLGHTVLAMALESLVAVLDRANWLLGPLPGVGTELRRMRDRTGLLPTFD